MIEQAVWDRNDLEPRIAEILERKQRLCRDARPYRPRTDDEVRRQLTQLFEAEGLRGIEIAGLSRMTGGASKEQFAFTLAHAASAQAEKLVLRMDPTMGVVETCRGREAQILTAVREVLPVPPVRYVDRDGAHLGQPGLVTAFVPGVTKPTTMRKQTVSGVGIDYGELTPVIATQFVDNLVRLHAFDWHAAALPDFAAPAAGTRQAALRQVNWWARVWAQDLVEPLPLMTFVERWLRENAPPCAAPVLVHGDYRAGNFMFAEPGGEFTAVLDWELAHVGDFHDDLAWSAQKLFGSRVDDEIFVSGLMSRREFFERYEAGSGRRLDCHVFRYYEVLNAWKCAVLDLSTACRAAAAGLSHQDLVLAWVALTGAVFMEQAIKLIEEAH